MSKSPSRFRFSHKAIDRLQAPPKDGAASNKEYSDEVEIGLRIAVFKSGRKSWRFRFTVDSEKGTITFGTFPAINVEKARELTRDCKVLIAEGRDPRTVRQEKRQSPTLQQFVDDIYLPFAERERSSIKDIRNRLKNKILPVLGKKKLSQITKADIAVMINKLATEISGTTANRTKSLCSAIFNKAIEFDLMTSNPTKGIKKLKENGPRTRYMDDDEVTRFLHVLNTEVEKGNLSAQAIYVLFFSGLRRSEVLSARWENLSLERGTLFIPKPKNGQPRTAPLNSFAVQMLRKIKEERGHNSPFIFNSRAKSGHMHEVRKTLKSIMKQSNIECLTTHDLRRGFASMIANIDGGGVDLRTIGELIGHKDIRTTQRTYAHLANKSLQNASELLVTKVEGLMAANS